MPHGNESDFHDPADSNAASYGSNDPDKGSHPINEIDPIVADKEAEDFRNLGRVLAPVLVWVCQATTFADIGMRFKVFAYLLRSDLIGGATLEEIGGQNGVTRQAVNKLARDFEKTFGVHGINQRKAETRQKCRSSHLKTASS